MTNSPITSMTGRLAALLLTAVALVLALAAAPPPVDAKPRADGVQRSLDALVRDGGYPGALASVRGRDGRTRDYVAGVGDRRTGAKPPVDGRVRIGSNTKTFTAVTVLQLVGEGKVDLDAPIERYLPKLIRGAGIDGRRITVRQLLQHRSGLPDYVPVLYGNGFLPLQHVYASPRDLLDTALDEKAAFAPGARWAYSNTNYLVAGLLVEKVTGRPVGEEITRRVIDRIGLRATTFPTVGDEGISGPHPRGYHHDDPGKPLTDVTEWDPAFGWAAGAIIASPSDINRFFTALLDGRLLEPAQMKEMRRTVSAPGATPQDRYGLGLISNPLSCGGLAWGHGGSFPGYSTMNVATEDGRAATIALNELPTTQPQIDRIAGALDRALCGTPRRSRAKG